MGNTDLNLSNFSFGAPTLPPPDQLGGQMPTAPGQAGTAGASAPTGDKGVGGSVSGVGASKGALAATGVNSLVVDPGVQSAMSTSGLSGTGMDAGSVLGAAPTGMPPADLAASLGNVATNLDYVTNVVNSFVSSVGGLLGFSAPEGAIKGDGDVDGTKKGERGGEGKGKAEGKGKGGGGSSSPTAGSSVSRAESPTGETITTVTTETVNSSGAVITNTSTTMSAGSPPPAKDSSGTGTGTTTEGTTGSTESAPPPQSGCDLSTIMAEMGTLTNSESQTMAQQQTSMIDAISLQASDTLAGAAALVKGAYQMMAMATTGFAVSMATSFYSATSIGSASKEADDAESQAMSEQEASLNTAAERSSLNTETATNPATKSTDSIGKAQNAIHETQLSAKEQLTKGNITQSQKDSIDAQTAASQKSLDNANYMAGGTKDPAKEGNPSYAGSPEHTQANADAAKVGKGPINSPEEATSFYNGQAKDIQSTRTAGGTVSIAQIKKQGIKPGSNLSDEDARQGVYDSWPPEKQDQYNALGDPKSGVMTQRQKDMINGPAKEFQTSVKNLSVNQHSSTWQNAYQNKYQQTQIWAGAGNAISQTFNAAGQMQDQLANAKNAQFTAAAQVQGATIQSLSTGFSQTEQVAEQLRQNQTAVAQDMSSMVSSTRV